MQKKSVSPKKTSLWSIRGMSRSTRNMFVGQCKTEGMKVAELLEFICLKYVREKRVGPDDKTTVHPTMG